MPAEYRHAVRIGVCGKVFSFLGIVATGAPDLVGIVMLWLNLCTRGYHS